MWNFSGFYHKDTFLLLLLIAFSVRELSTLFLIGLVNSVIVIRAERPRGPSILVSGLSRLLASYLDSGFILALLPLASGIGGFNNPFLIVD
jgi:hypothetical protein